MNDVILLYGQPSSGKTTLGDLLADTITSEQSVRVDGDLWRDVTQNKDYSKEGRMRNLKGAYDMAIYLSRAGFLPILSFVSPYEELRQYLRSNSNLIEIYLECTEDRGRNDYFAKDFEYPSTKCLRLNTSELTEIDCLHKIIDYIKINKNG
jgi:adenylylsulfate kinase